MSAKFSIKDGSGTNKVVKVLEKDNENALFVTTIPRKTYYTKPQKFSNLNKGTELSQDASGTYSIITQVHNGGDDVLWTPTIIASNAADFDFNSTGQAHTGTQSIDCTSSEGSDIFQLTDASEHESSDFNILAGWVYVTGAWTLPNDGVDIYLWNSSSGTQSSTNSIDLDDYINGANVDVWQRFVLQMDDFGTTSTFDSIRFEMLEDGAPPNFYLDDIQFETTATSGGTLVYKIEPTIGINLHVSSITYRIVDNYDSTVLNGTIPNIPYDGFLGLSTLESGILYQQINNGVVENSFVINNFSELLDNCFTQITGYGSDGTNTWVTVNTKFCEPIVLNYETRDEIRFVINDDLSNLISFRISAECKQENIISN